MVEMGQLVFRSEGVDEALRRIRGDCGSRSTTEIGYDFNQPTVKESSFGLVIAAARGDSPDGEAVSHLGKPEGQEAEQKL